MGVQIIEILRYIFRQIKEARKRQQTENVRKKQEKLEEHKQRSLEGIKRKAEQEKEEAGIENPEIDAGW